MKKISVLFSLGLLLAGGSFMTVSATVTHPSASTSTLRAAFPDYPTSQAYKQGTKDAKDYLATSPSAADIAQAKADADEYLAESEPNSVDYFYWRGYRDHL